ncbi:MAG: ABC transporter permease [Phycisphaeraceae bacterium]|nr:MAG: ABC transporter permease [Phycisphaeraceae bacterium]
MSPALSIAMNDLRLLLRDRVNAFFVFVFPLLFAMFFGSIFGGGGEGRGRMTVAVVDEDRTPASLAFVESLRADEALAVGGPMSMGQAESLVRQGKTTALVFLPEGFGEASDGLFAGRSLPIRAKVDPSRRAEAGLLTGKLNEIAFRRMTGLFSGEGWRDRLALARDRLAREPVAGPRGEALGTLLDDLGVFYERMESADDAAPDESGRAGEGGGVGGFSPVDVKVEELTRDLAGRPKNSYEVSFPQGIVWGLMGCVMGFGVSLAHERTRGTLVRLTTAPISRGTILLGKALACFVACLLVQAMLLGFGMLVFGIRLDGPSAWAMMGLAVLCSSVGFAGVMMFVAGISQTGPGAEGFGRALILILTMIGGGTVPLFMLPGWMQTAGMISPFTWATRAIEGALWRGFSPGEMALPCVVLIGFGAAGWVVGVRAMKWTT